MLGGPSDMWLPRLYQIDSTFRHLRTLTEPIFSKDPQKPNPVQLFLDTEIAVRAIFSCSSVFAFLCCLVGLLLFMVDVRALSCV